MRRTLVVLFMLAIAVAAPTDAVASARQNSGGLQLVDAAPLSRDAQFLRMRLPGLVSPTDVLDITVHEAISSRADFLITTDRSTAGESIFAATFEVADLEPTLTGLVEIPVDFAAMGLDGSTEGVYPVVVEMDTGAGAKVGSLLTYLVIPPVIPTPSRTALALMIEVRPGENAAGNIDDDDPLATWIDALIARPDLPVTLQATPLLFENYAFDSRIRALRTRLADEALVAGPYLPVDERALEAEGFGEDAALLLARGVDALTNFAGRAPDATLKLSPAWPDADRAAIWRDRGVRSIVSVGSSPFDAPIDAETSSGTVSMMVIPERFADPNPENPTAAANRILSELAVIAVTADHPTSSVLLFSTGQPTSSRFVEDLLDGLAEMTPLITPATVADAFATNHLTTPSGQRMSISLEQNTETPRLDGGVVEYREAEQMLTAYRSMIRDEDTGYLYDEQLDKLVSLLGSGVTGDQRAQAAEEIVDAVRIEILSIRPPPLEQVNLTSRTATYPFAFQNNAEYPVRIEARFIADKARFNELEDGESLNLVLEPGVSSREINVEALASGSFPMRIELWAPDGSLLLGSVDLEVRSTAPSGIGVLISVLAGSVLILWWGRELLRSRRKSQGNDAGDQQAEEDLVELPA